MLSDIWINENCNFNNVFFDIPHIIKPNIQSSSAPNLRITRDTSSWILTRNGAFSFRSVYYHISQSGTSNTITNNLFNCIWKAKTPNKIKFFLWLFQHNSLPTKATLSYRGIDLNPYCRICNHPLEDNSHIFCDCDFAKSF